jgi:hypothetical protein
VIGDAQVRDYRAAALCRTDSLRRQHLETTLDGRPGQQGRGKQVSLASNSRDHYVDFHEMAPRRQTSRHRLQLTQVRVSMLALSPANRIAGQPKKSMHPAAIALLGIHADRVLCK